MFFPSDITQSFCNVRHLWQKMMKKVTRYVGTLRFLRMFLICREATRLNDGKLQLECLDTVTSGYQNVQVTLIFKNSSIYDEVIIIQDSSNTILHSTVTFFMYQKIAQI